MKRKTIASIDVGTTKVCTIMADIDGRGGIRILGVGVAPSHGLHKGLVVNIGEAKNSIRQSVKEAERSAGYKLESAYVGVTGRHVASLNNRGVVAISRNDRMVRPGDLKRVLNCARTIKVPTDTKVLHIIPRSYAVDGQEGIRDPVGMHGFRLDVETHIITAAVTSIQNLVKCIRGIGIDVDDLVLEPLASSEAVLMEDEKQVGIILADIGGGTTDICVFKGGSIYHSSVLPVAGYQITRDISIGLGLSFDLAEQMKKKYGSVIPVYDAKVNASKTAIENGHTVSYQDLSDIIRVRVEEVLRLILLELPRSDYEKFVPGGLVLTGGSSNLAGIDTLACEILRLPARVGTPINLYGITDILHNPAYATGVGLLLWAVNRDKTVGKQTWRPSGFRSSLWRLASQFAKLFR